MLSLLSADIGDIAEELAARIEGGIDVPDRHELLQDQGEGTASPAPYPSGPGGTPGTGCPLSRSERQAEASENIGYHLHPGPREGAGFDYQLTKASAGQLTACIAIPSETACLPRNKKPNSSRSRRKSPRRGELGLTPAVAL